MVEFLLREANWDPPTAVEYLTTMKAIMMFWQAVQARQTSHLRRKMAHVNVVTHLTNQMGKGADTSCTKYIRQDTSCMLYAAECGHDVLL
jgi:hypothetical protein